MCASIPPGAFHLARARKIACWPSRGGSDASSLLRDHQCGCSQDKRRRPISVARFAKIGQQNHRPIDLVEVCAVQRPPGIRYRRRCIYVLCNYSIIRSTFRIAVLDFTLDKHHLALELHWKHKRSLSIGACHRNALFNAQARAGTLSEWHQSH
jgi:hypothetical protein